MKNGFTGKRQKALQVPGKEGKELSQSSCALHVSPRQTLLTALWGPGAWPGEKNRAQTPLPTPASYSSCCLLHWHRLSQVSNTNGPQTESSAVCGSLSQELLVWAMMAPAASLGPESGPQLCGQGPVSDVVLGPGCSLELGFGLDRSIREDLTHWAGACFELRCIAYTCKTNLGTHKCVINYFAPPQSVY